MVWYPKKRKEDKRGYWINMPDAQHELTVYNYSIQGLRDKPEAGDYFTEPDNAG